MPELAEVEIVRRNLEKWWTSSALEVRWLDSRFGKKDQDRIDLALKSKPLRFLRRGKHLVIQTQKGGIYFHLRMTGKIVKRETWDIKFARLAFKLSKNNWLLFIDTRRLGSVDFLEGESLPRQFEDLGPEPEAVSVAYFNERIGKKKGLKSALLDQKIVAGLGNIAITELFWIYKISPQAKWGDLDEAQKEELCAGLAPYFDALIEKEEGDEIAYTNEPGASNPFLIYKRLGEPCPQCSVAIERMKVASRSTYFCPSCQASDLKK